ncbi:MAG: SAM-dependent methyltransferase [Oscillospiraceae bacterium]|nr:SAM-dependent methyltransferase [Oscillospiraceae bacterium]
MKIPISNRLLCCAALVPPGARMADVGCDHGYLGIYLLKEDRASFVTALDLRPSPLARARANAARFGVTDRMRFLVCDGLRSVCAGEADTVVCAGMGGDAIAGILAQCRWVRDPRVTLVLQPQSSGNDLRRWLGENGFSIVREPLVRCGGFLYTAMEARYGGGVPVSPGAQYVSPQILEGEAALVRDYLDRVTAGIARAVEGIARARRGTGRLAYYETALREVLEMREQFENRIRDHEGAL